MFFRQFIKNKDINGFMFFRNYENEIKYFKQMDPLFKYYVAFELIVLICVYLIQNLTLDRYSYYLLLILQFNYCINSV